MKKILFVLLFVLLGFGFFGVSYAGNVNDILSGTTIQNSYSYTATAATTVVKTGQGVLRRLIVEGGTTGTIIIYDNTAASGTIIASFDTTNALANYQFDVPFVTGLTVVTGGNTKITVIYS